MNIDINQPPDVKIEDVAPGKTFFAEGTYWIMTSEESGSADDYANPLRVLVVCLETGEGRRLDPQQTVNLIDLKLSLA